MTDRYYVYAITAPDVRLPDDVVGFGGPLQILTYGELGAVVSQAGADSGDGEHPDASAQNLLLHERVVEAVRARGQALPVRFGTLLSDAVSVAHALRTQYAVLLADLRRLGDTSEMTVSALRPLAVEPPRAHENGGTVGPQADSELSALADRGRGLAYLRSRQAMYREAESAREHAQALAHELDTALRPLALDARHSLCPSARLALRAVYLIARDREQPFAKIFEDVRRHHPDVRLLMSGPWPPYSFVTAPAHRDVSGEEREECRSIGSSDGRQQEDVTAAAPGSAVRSIQDQRGDDDDL